MLRNERMKIWKGKTEMKTELVGKQSFFEEFYFGLFPETHFLWCKKYNYITNVILSKKKCGFFSYMTWAGWSGFVEFRHDFCKFHRVNFFNCMYSVNNVACTYIGIYSYTIILNFTTACEKIEKEDWNKKWRGSGEVSF